MIELILGAAIASQAALPQPARETIEVGVSADGVAKVPPQAYQVIAFLGLPDGSPPAAKPVDLAALKNRLAKLEMRSRDTCMPGSALGFVGNEASDEDSASDSGADDNGDAGGGADGATGWTLFSSSPERYSGLFATKDQANAAADLLRKDGHVQSTTKPVLFDCADAVRLAELDALAKAQQQIQPIADALGRRVLGATRIEFARGETTVEFALAMSGYNFGGARTEVDMPARARVVFLLGK
jgi:hypothetical protein